MSIRSLVQIILHPRHVPTDPSCEVYREPRLDGILSRKTRGITCTVCLVRRSNAPRSVSDPRGWGKEFTDGSPTEKGLIMAWADQNCDVFESHDRGCSSDHIAEVGMERVKQDLLLAVASRMRLDDPVDPHAWMERLIRERNGGGEHRWDPVSTPKRN